MEKEKTPQAIPKNINADVFLHMNFLVQAANLSYNISPNLSRHYVKTVKFIAEKSVTRL